MRHDARVLHHDRVASHQMRPGDARQLVIREVPGLHGEYYADGAAFCVALTGLRMQGHVGEEMLGLLGIIFQDLFGLGSGQVADARLSAVHANLKVQWAARCS